MKIMMQSFAKKRHKVIDEKINLHNVRLNDHSDRLKKLERRSSACR
ncbi:hemolysin XhlA family protein [Clostridium acetobutylicum]|nr:hemolysin XhlA family protein [Clostridium acetobutylicum]